jgi:hypothetical protein
MTTWIELLSIGDFPYCRNRTKIVIGLTTPFLHKCELFFAEILLFHCGRTTSKTFEGAGDPSHLHQQESTARFHAPPQLRILLSPTSGFECEKAQNRVIDHTVPSFQESPSDPVRLVRARYAAPYAASDRVIMY